MRRGTMSKFIGDCPSCGSSLEFNPPIDVGEWYQRHNCEYRCPCGRITTLRKPDNEPEVPQI